MIKTVSEYVGSPILSWQIIIGKWEGKVHITRAGKKWIKEKEAIK